MLLRNGHASERTTNTEYNKYRFAKKLGLFLPQRKPLGTLRFHNMSYVNKKNDKRHMRTLTKINSHLQKQDVDAAKIVINSLKTLYTLSFACGNNNIVIF